MTMQEAMALMRGKPNTKIALTLLRKGEPTHKTFADARPHPDQERQIQADRAGLRLHALDAIPGAHTASNWSTAFEALYIQNRDPLRGLVLDMRDNPGGLVSAAVAVAAAFLPPTSRS